MTCPPKPKETISLIIVWQINDIATMKCHKLTAMTVGDADQAFSNEIHQHSECIAVFSPYHSHSCVCFTYDSSFPVSFLNSVHRFSRLTSTSYMRERANAGAGDITNAAGVADYAPYAPFYVCVY